MVAGLEQGVVALLGSKSTSALLKLTKPSDLALTCCAIVALLLATPRKAAVVGRVSVLLIRVLLTITLNASLQWVTEGFDTPLVCLNLLTVFFWGSSLNPDGSIGITAQYLLVSKLSQRLRGFQDDSALPIAWAVASLPVGLLSQDAAELALLTTTETMSSWLQDWFPRDMLMPSTAILLYLCAPFARDFPALDRLYRFAVFSFTNDLHFTHTPPWLLATSMWVLWRLDADAVSRRLATVAGSSLAVLAVLDAMRFAIDNDPAPTLVALLVTIRILEEVAL
jgi:hypothetical protein